MKQSLQPPAERGPSTRVTPDVLERSVMPKVRSRVQILPSILAADFSDIGMAIRTVESGGADALHLDSMDGQFVPNLSWGPKIVREAGARAGLAINLQTPTAMLVDFVEDCDQILVMSVESGFGGQAFIEHALIKVRQVRNSRVASSGPLFGRFGLPPMMFDPQLGEPIELI